MSFATDNIEFCGQGWTLGRDKCYRFIGSRRFRLADAKKECRKLGEKSGVFSPSSWDETDVLKTLAADGSLPAWTRHSYENVVSGMFKIKTFSIKLHIFMKNLET